MHTQDTAQANPRFRVDVQLHDLLVKNQSKNLLLPAHAEPTSLPDPIYPQHAELQNMPDPDTFPDNRKWTAPLVYRAMRGWLFPYFRSRTLPGDFHPIIAYLFTEWKSNLGCWYCWPFDNKVKGMTEDTARRAIDWLYDSGCRVLALMGGEPLLRPQFVHKVVYYAARRASGSMCRPTAGCCVPR